jgi:hypothetical protein
MKNIYYIILATFLLTSTLNAQTPNNNSNPFVGTWEYQDGNEIFRVILWTDNDNEHIKGHYEKVINNNGIESYVLSSDKEKHEGQNQSWIPYSIFCVIDNQVMGGIIIDNTVNSNLYHFRKNGKLKFILNNNLTTANWRIESSQGPKINEAPEFSVPTDIILTKVE